MGRALRDVNRVTTAIAVDSATGLSPTPLEVDSSTGELLVKSSATISGAEIDGTALSNGQTSVDTTAGGTTIIAAAAARQGVTITNQGSVDCYIGSGTLTTSNGFLLKPGESVGLTTDSEIKGIVASGSTTVGYLAFA